MGMCKGCGEVFNANTMIDGYCENCVSSDKKFLHEQNEKISKEKKCILDERKQNIKKNKTIIDQEIIFTSETYIKEPIDERIEFISTQRIYGINIVKEFFNFFNDILGGRINSLENALNDAIKSIEQEFKEKAYLIGADAVIAVKIEHTYNNANNGSILSVFATGTVVRLKKD